MNKYVLAISYLLMCLLSNSQHIITLQPGPCDGKSAYLGTYQPDENFGGDEEIDAFTWTCSSTICTARSVFQFDLTNIPPGTTISSALLSLWYNSTTHSNPLPEQGNNAFHIYPVNEYWNQYSVTWNRQPTYDTTNTYVGAQSTTTTQDYLNMDVTAMVQKMVSNPASNNGFLIKPDDEVTYTALIFCSPYYMNDPSKRPQLTISYTGDSILSDSNGCSVTAAANKLIMCAGDSVQICATRCFTSYNWNTGDTTVCITTPYEGDYNVTVTSGANCTAMSNTVQVNIYPPTPVIVSINADTLACYSGSSYQWLLGDSIIAGATLAAYVAKFSGTYAVRITDANGCLFTSSPIIMTDITKGMLNSYFSVSPNPTNAFWQLAVSNELIGTTAEIFDAGGRLVYQWVISARQSTISLPEIACGIYQLRIGCHGYSVIRKLVKM